MKLTEYTHGGLMAEKVKPDPQPDLGNASVGKCLTKIFDFDFCYCLYNDFKSPPCAYLWRAFLHAIMKEWRK